MTAGSQTTYVNAQATGGSLAFQAVTLARQITEFNGQLQAQGGASYLEGLPDFPAGATADVNTLLAGMGNLAAWAAAFGTGQLASGVNLNDNLRTLLGWNLS